MHMLSFIMLIYILYIYIHNEFYYTIFLYSFIHLCSLFPVSQTSPTCPLMISRISSFAFVCHEFDFLLYFFSYYHFFFLIYQFFFSRLPVFTNSNEQATFVSFLGNHLDYTDINYLSEAQLANISSNLNAIA